VESIEVIKGAAGASLYGSQAANGVIQIITKRGADNPNATDFTARTEWGITDLQRLYPLNKSHRWRIDPTTGDFQRASTHRYHTKRFV
jgi:TonB-dependent SusC/RagA subfamily outer membrane receptor